MDVMCIHTRPDPSRALPCPALFLDTLRLLEGVQQYRTEWALIRDDPMLKHRVSGPGSEKEEEEEEKERCRGRVMFVERCKLCFVLCCSICSL